MQCPTVEIQTEVRDNNPTGVIVINESDFDPETMILVGAEVKPSTAKSVVNPPVITPPTGGNVAPPWANNKELS